jgi:hypothetical protein
MLKRDIVFAIVPKLNILLTVSAVVLAGVLAESLVRPYQVNRQLKLKPLQIDAQSAYALSEPVKLNEELFRKVNLFNVSKKSKGFTGQKQFVLLGVSVGTKSLAMIRDTRQNKDFYCAVGDAVGEYKVMYIGKDKVVLGSGSDTVEITR